MIFLYKVVQGIAFPILSPLSYFHNKVSLHAYFLFILAISICDKLNYADKVKLPYLNYIIGNEGLIASEEKLDI